MRLGVNLYDIICSKCLYNVTPLESPCIVRYDRRRKERPLRGTSTLRTHAAQLHRAIRPTACRVIKRHPHTSDQVVIYATGTTDVSFASCKKKSGTERVEQYRARACNRRPRNLLFLPPVSGTSVPQPFIQIATVYGIWSC